MAEPHDQSRPSELFDVVIVGFAPHGDAPEVGLKRVFGIDDATAQKLVQSLPATVQRGVNRVRAEYFRKALDLIGAQVEVRNPSGALEPAPGTTPSAARQPSSPPETSSAAGVAEPAAAVAQASPPLPLAIARPRMATEIAAPLSPEDRAAPRAPTPLEIATQPVAFGVTLAMRDMATPPSAASPPTKPAVLPMAEPAPQVKAPANATLKEGVAVRTLLHSLGDASQHDTSPIATADTQSLPRAAFRFGDTAAPFMRGILGDSPSTTEQPASPLPAGPTSFNLPMPVAAALPHPAQAGAPVPPPVVLPEKASDVQPVVLPPPLAAAPPAMQAAPLSAGPGVSYGGFSWGEIDRGRHSRPPLPLAAPAEAGEVVLPPARDPAPSLELEVARPASPDPALQHAAKPIGASAKLVAPSPREMAAAIRKQQIQAQASGLGAERADTPKTDGILREAHEQSKAARARRAFLEGSEAGPRDQAEAADAPKARPGPPRAEAAASPRRATPAREPTAARPSAPSPAAVPAGSFWQSLGAALVFPVQGEGLTWLLKISVWSIAMSGAIHVAGKLGALGVALAFCARTSLLAFCADLHRQSLWKTVEGGQELDRGATMDAATLGSYFGAGLHVSVFTLVSQLPVVLWSYRTYFPSAGAENPFTIFLAPLFWVLAIGPGFYWPMALATASLHNDFSGAWNVPMGLRAFVRAPAECATIVVLGALCLLGVWAPFLIVGFVAHLPQVFFDATWGPGLAFSCSVMGALTGHLARSRTDVFQQS